MRWLIYAFMGMLFLGVGNFLMRFATASGQPSLGASFLQIAMMFLLAAGVVLFKKPEIFASLPGSLAATTGGLSVGLGTLLFIVALGQPNAHGGIATAVLNTNFVVVLMLGFIVLHEPVTLKQGVGLAAILGGLLLLI
jgi:uncharacterized membrane protein